MPNLKTGDVVAMPAGRCVQTWRWRATTTACRAPRWLMVGDGKAQVIRRRETLDDLVAAEIF